MITPEGKSAIERYEQIKLEMKELEKEMEELKPIVIAVVPEDTTVEAAYGTLSIARRTQYLYSLDTQLAEDALKAAKAREVQDGTATAKPGDPYIVYKEKKA